MKRGVLRIKEGIIKFKRGVLRIKGVILKFRAGILKFRVGILTPLFLCSIGPKTSLKHPLTSPIPSLI